MPASDLETAVRDLRQHVIPAAPLDYKGLMQRGYTEHEAHALLRSRGVRVPGGRRRRISIAVLEAIERGDTPA